MKTAAATRPAQPAPPPVRQKMFSPTRRRVGVFVPSPIRLRRFGLELTLFDLARAARMSTTRVSYAERSSPRARPGDLARLEATMAKIEARRAAKAKAAGVSS